MGTDSMSVRAWGSSTLDFGCTKIRMLWVMARSFVRVRPRRDVEIDECFMADFLIDDFLIDDCRLMMCLERSVERPVAPFFDRISGLT